jgi:ATP-dependent RNA helicase RhlE
MSQIQRDRAMQGFRGRRFDVLVATDIAARGLDVDQVSHVINFDVPNTPEAYTHRIGRTGRSNRSGKAYTFVTENDHKMVHAIERNIGEPIPRSTVKGFEGVSFPPTGEVRRMGRKGPSGRGHVQTGGKRGQRHRRVTGDDGLVGGVGRRSQKKRRRLGRRSG